MEGKEDEESRPVTQGDKRITDNVSRISEATTLTEGQLKGYKHNKIFEAIIPEENKLLCIDGVKESNKKTEKLQISDLSMLIQDKMNENIEILERYQTILSKEPSIQGLLRKFFKSMHVILYEIENSKKLELDHAIAAVFGPNIDVKETKRVVEKLRDIYK